MNNRIIIEEIRFRQRVCGYAKKQGLKYQDICYTPIF